MSTRHHSRLSTPGLLRRQFFAGPGPSIMLALLVLVGALLATAVPRAVAAMHTAALGQELAEVPANELDLTTATRAIPDIGPSGGATTLPDDVDAVWGNQEQHLLDIQAGMPQPLQRHHRAAPLDADGRSRSGLRAGRCVELAGVPRAPGFRPAAARARHPDER